MPKKNHKEKNRGQKLLLPGQLSQRFLRIQDQYPSVEDDEPALEERAEEKDLFDLWREEEAEEEAEDPFFFYTRCMEEWFNKHETEVMKTEAYWKVMNTFLSKTFVPSSRYVSSCLGLPWWPSKSSKPLEVRLKFHIEMLANFRGHSRGDSRELLPYLQESITTFNNIRVLKSEWPDKIYIVKRLCLFAPFWLRSPQTWDSEGERSLLDHLFVHYKVPDFLYHPWFESDFFESQWVEQTVPRVKWLCWFILFGQGGSLKRANLFENPNQSERPLGERYLWEVPSETPPNQALTYAIIRSFGGSNRDALRFLQSPEFDFYPYYPTSSEDVELLFDVGRWMVHHGSKITEEQSLKILSWFRHKHTERGTFDIERLGVRFVLEQTDNYFQQIKQRKACASQAEWEGHGWNCKSEESSFQEITTEEELFQEGMEMQHCVNLYIVPCLSGTSAIFSFQRNNQRIATIEVNPKTRELVQVRGKYNASVGVEDLKFIESWHNNWVQKPVLSIDASILDLKPTFKSSIRLQHESSDVDCELFIRLLAGSVSMNLEAKASVLIRFETLSVKQVDQILSIFHHERREIQRVYQEEEQMEVLQKDMQQRDADWILLEDEYGNTG